MHEYAKEGPLASMEVPWSLKGATLHNITVALCISPALHHFLTLIERCEAAVCGFVLLDLWKLCADKKASDLGVPKGTTWMAIEHQFGHLRSQVASAQLSTRGFWHADARQSLKVNDVLNKCKPTPAATERALNDSESLAMIGCKVHQFHTCSFIF